MSVMVIVAVAVVEERRSGVDLESEQVARLDSTLAGLSIVDCISPSSNVQHHDQSH